MRSVCPTASAPDAQTDADPSAAGSLVDAEREAPPATSPEETADRVTAIAAARGDRAAFGRILDRHGPRVMAVCRRMARDEHQAEDLCQDVFVHLFRALPKYDGARAFRPWLMRVAANICLNRLRAERRRPAISLDAHHDAGGPPPTTSTEGPEVSAAKRELFDRIRRERAALSPDDRLILALRYDGGLGHREISESLGGLPLGTVKVRLHRARKVLAARLRRFVAGGDV